MGAQARGDGVEIGVVVAGVADELPCAVGDGTQHGVQGGAVEVACGGDADCATRGEDAVSSNGRRGFKAATAGLERPDKEAATCASTERGGPARLEGVADAVNTGLLKCEDDGACDTREKMRVLVCVDVGEFEAGASELLNLCECLALDLVLADGAAQDAEREVAERVAEGAVVGTEKSGDGFGGRDWCAIDEDDVAADPEGWACSSESDGVFERRSVGHQGGRRDGASVMQLGDGAIDAARETEVVCIDDESNWHLRTRHRGYGLKVRSLRECIAWVDEVCAGRP